MRDASRLDLSSSSRHVIFLLHCSCTCGDERAWDTEFLRLLQYSYRIHNIHCIHKRYTVFIRDIHRIHKRPHRTPKSCNEKMHSHDLVCGGRARGGDRHLINRVNHPVRSTFLAMWRSCFAPGRSTWLGRSNWHRKSDSF